jgi:hypothetical protein
VKEDKKWDFAAGQFRGKCSTARGKRVVSSSTKYNKGRREVNEVMRNPNEKRKKRRLDSEDSDAFRDDERRKLKSSVCD